MSGYISKSIKPPWKAKFKVGPAIFVIISHLLKTPPLNQDANKHAKITKRLFDHSTTIFKMSNVYHTILIDVCAWVHHHSRWNWFKPSN